MGSTSRRAAELGLASVLVASAGALTSGAAATDLAKVGQFGAPFEESGPACVSKAEGTQVCKPAGASVVVLDTGRVLYWNALEGTENVQLNTVAEFGNVSINDQSRVLDLSGPAPSWSRPTPNDGGANPDGNTNQYAVPGAPWDGPNHGNGGDLFCADQVQLADGRILTTGGTSYYEEPNIPGTGYGVAELEGLKNARIFDPATLTWSQTGAMHYGRWYPSLVTLPDGKVFVASGVTKLIKPMYPDRPADSGTNVVQTETYDPATRKWSDNGPDASRSLPLFPRLHLLPDGKVFYDGGGHTFT